MTRIEKAVKIVSDLRDFYRQIPKIGARDRMKQEKLAPESRHGAREHVPRASRAADASEHTDEGDVRL